MFKVLTTLIIATAVLLVSCAEGPDGEAELILSGGRIWYGPGAPVTTGEAPTAIAIAGGRVLAVGSDAEVEELIAASTARIDLAGRRVVPGIMDSHTHFIAGGFDLAGVQLRDAATPAEFARRIDEFAARHPDGWVSGGQWDHELWGGELPRRDWIDSLTSGTPVFVNRLDGHMGLANGRALELAGITAETPDPPGGTIVRYPDGRPTGILKDDAMALVYDAMPPPSEEERDRALQAAMEHAVARGITMITDMGSWEDLATYRRARERGELPIRVYSVVPLASWERLAEFVEGEGRGDHRLFWGGLKGFVDGSLGSTTAWFYEPYDDEPESSGLVVIDDTTEFKGWI
ncbi:MAG: amidohydrolase family protein, partial [Gemmatimonadales bacterium]